jgi:hypothetical protein
MVSATGQNRLSTMAIRPSKAMATPMRAASTVNR